MLHKPVLWFHRTLCWSTGILICFGSIISQKSNIKPTNYMYMLICKFICTDTVKWMSGRTNGQTDRQMYIQISIYSKSLRLLRSVQGNMSLLLCLVWFFFPLFLIFRFLIWLHHAMSVSVIWLETFFITHFLIICNFIIIEILLWAILGKWYSHSIKESSHEA